MKKCPFCGENLQAIPVSRIKNRYFGGCANDDCPVIFRTKKPNDKLHSCMEIYDILRKSKLDE